MKVQKRVLAKRAAGMSLVEVMFSMTVLVVGLLGSEALIASYASIRRLNEETQMATLAARRQLDLIRASDFSALASTYNDSDFQVDVNNDSVNDLLPQSDDADGNTGKVTVTEVGPVGFESTLLQVEVTIEWNGIGGDRQYQIATLISDRS